MLYIMLAAAYPFGRPEDENLKPAKKMHVMLQVLLCPCSCPALPCRALPCPAVPCSCPALPCPHALALPCAALPCPAHAHAMPIPANRTTLLCSALHALSWHLPCLLWDILLLPLPPVWGWPALLEALHVLHSLSLPLPSALPRL